MGFHGIPSGSRRDSHGIPSESYGLPWDSHRISWESHGILWNPHRVPGESHRIPSDSRGIPQDSHKLYIPLDFIHIHVEPNEISMYSCDLTARDLRKSSKTRIIRHGVSAGCSEIGHVSCKNSEMSVNRHGRSMIFV